MANISREEIKNLISEHEIESAKTVAALGCQTLIGCGKTKELETYLNGKLKSDLFDLSTAQKHVTEILEKMTKDISGMKNLIQMDEADLNKKLEKSADKIKNENRSFNFWFAMAVLTLLGGKIFQDYINQNQTVAFLKELNTSVAILQEHDKQFQNHLFLASKLNKEEKKNELDN